LTDGGGRYLPAAGVLSQHSGVLDHFKDAATAPSFLDRNHQIAMPRRSLTGVTPDPLNPDAPFPKPARAKRQSPKRKKPASSATDEIATDSTGSLVRALIPQNGASGRATTDLTAAICPADPSNEPRSASRPPGRKRKPGLKKPKLKSAGRALVVWVESPPLVPLVPEVTREKTSDVFYPPVLVPAPPRSFLADMRLVATRLLGPARQIFLVRQVFSATVAAVPPIVRSAYGRLARFCAASVCLATDLRRRFYPRNAISVVGSFYGMARKPIFIAGRVTAVVLPCLIIYAAVTMPAPPKQLAEVRATAAALATNTRLAPVSTTLKPAGDGSHLPAESSASAHTLTDVKIVNAPRLNPFCREQTWPYVTQRCLAARNGRIGLTADSSVSVPNASSNSANAVAAPDAAGKTAARKAGKPGRAR
jgi:hypothetical protein